MQPAAAPQSKQKASTQSARKSAAKPTKKKSSAGAARQPGKRATTKSARRPSSRRVYRRAQASPTPERFREIQQALTSKGYFGGASDGKWGTDSVEALKRFQSDQNLEPTGKINSLSLIALGLGPKYEKTPEPADRGH